MFNEDTGKWSFPCITDHKVNGDQEDPQLKKNVLTRTLHISKSATQSEDHIVFSPQTDTQEDTQECKCKVRKTNDFQKTITISKPKL